MTISKEHIRNTIKKENAQFLILVLLTKNPNLTKTQIRRIFSYGYGMMTGDSGEKFYQIAQDLKQLQSQAVQPS